MQLKHSWIAVAHITMLQRHLSTIIVVVPDYQCMSSDCTWLCIESRSSGELWLFTWEIEQLYDIMKCSSIKHFWEGSFQPHQVKNKIHWGQFQRVRRICVLDAYFHHITKWFLDRWYNNTISTCSRSGGSFCLNELSLTESPHLLLQTSPLHKGQLHTVILQIGEEAQAPRPSIRLWNQFW